MRFCSLLGHDMSQVMVQASRYAHKRASLPARTASPSICGIPPRRDAYSEERHITNKTVSFVVQKMPQHHEKTFTIFYDKTR
jgi:hypothetical protein